MMMMITGLVLVTIGAVLRYAVDSDWDAVDVPVVGLILGCVGIVAFVVGLLQTFLLREQKPAAQQAPVQQVPQQAPPMQAPLPPAQAYPQAYPAAQPPAAPPAPPHS